MSTYVLIERREEFHQAFDGKLVEPIVFQRRGGGLWDAEQGGKFAWFQLACVESFSDREREASLDLPFGGIGLAHVGENVGGTAGNRGQGVLRRSSSA